MKIKPRKEIFNDIIRDSKKDQNGWMATFGTDEKTLSHDCYIYHKKSGLYLIKEYNKNPYHIKGVGSKIARNIDDDIEQLIHKKYGDFGIIQGNIHKIIQNINRGIHPDKIVSEGLKGNDLGIKIPVKGRMALSPDAYTYLHSNYKSKQKKVAERFEKIIFEDGFYNSYG
ncbi:MAG: hypothetical protein R6V50_04095 [Thermoplasmatota archaeon]